jgi:nucleoside-diphosphate-sugar epimerase
MSEMLKIAVTGATGFLGTALLSKLDTKQIVVIGRSKPDSIPDENFFEASLDKQLNLEEALTSVNVVIHCAGRAHVMNDDSVDPLAEFRRVNVEGTVNLAKQELGSRTGMEVVIIRPPLISGPGVKANFKNIMSLVSRGIPLPFTSIKNNRRSLVSVYNLVDLMMCCVNHPMASNQIFLVSDDDDLSTSRMIEELKSSFKKKTFGLPVPVWFFTFVGKATNKQSVISRLCGSLQVDITKTKDLLDWAPPVSLKEGFKLTAKHFNSTKQ